MILALGSVSTDVHVQQCEDEVLVMLQNVAGYSSWPVTRSLHLHGQWHGHTCFSALFSSPHYIPYILHLAQAPIKTELHRSETSLKTPRPDKKQLRLMEMSFLQVCDRNLKYWKNWNFDLMVVLDEKSRDQSDYRSSWRGMVSNHLIVVEIFKHNGGARLRVRITKVIRFHPLITMNVCTNFHSNPSNSCWEISFWQKVVDRQTNIAIEPCS